MQLPEFVARIIAGVRSETAAIAATCAPGQLNPPAVVASVEKINGLMKLLDAGVNAAPVEQPAPAAPAPVEAAPAALSPEPATAEETPPAAPEAAVT